MIIKVNLEEIDIEFDKQSDNLLQLYRALNRIKRECDKYDECSVCPMYDHYLNYCMFTDVNPNQLNFNYTKLTKYVN